MRITGKELKRIIREELARGEKLREAAGDWYDPDEVEAEMGARLDREAAKRKDPFAGVNFDEEPAAAAVKLPAQPPAPSGALAAGAARVPALAAIKEELPGELGRVMAQLKDPMVRKDLKDVYLGDKVLQVGASGPAVEVYQAVVLANLIRWAKTHRALGKELSSLAVDPVEVAQRAIKTGGNITDTDLMGAVELLTTIGGFTPDGQYGPKTRAAVALLQVIMQRRQIISTLDGAEIDWDAAIDGKIGRQTAQFLAGFTRLAPISGVTPAEAGGKPMAGGLVSGAGTLEEGIASTRWEKLAGILAD